jgi:hypothetical protein
VFSWIGWLATAITASSYFCKRSATLRAVQAVGAMVWIGYGIAVDSRPVVIANILVGFMAAQSAWRRIRQRAATAEAVAPEHKPVPLVDKPFEP